MSDILIVESAAKARTLQKYLGDGWQVFATGGHVETLPDDRRKHGRDASKAYWANRSGSLPSPPWVWTERGEEAVRKLVEKAGSDATFWIATDPDREGEFIAWCLDRLLEEHGDRHRVTFQEVTKEAVEEALQSPRDIDERMVDSALVRKFIDRLVGYRASKTANSVVPGRGNSMGRVQTPTLSFVVERELEREAHVPTPYFEVHGWTGGVKLAVRFHEPDDADAWRDDQNRFDAKRTFDGDLAQAAYDALEAAGGVTVESLDARNRSRSPSAPFSTDALLQAAGSRFGWSPRRTSAVASALYEAGHITYIRTDSTRLARSAVDAARSVVKEALGDAYLGEGAKGGEAKGPVQDAHEAIRPTRLGVEEAPVDDEDARRLYRLVRAQVLASQMAPSVRRQVSVEASCADLDRPLTGTVSWRTFDGWEAVYGEFLGDVATEPPELPLEEGARWDLDPATDDRDNPVLIEDETRPPARYRPHTLVKAMKDAGIGRPSTYSPTVDKLEERGYVELEDGALVPTERGRSIILDAAPLYTREGDDGSDPVQLFDPEFTALMERRLDEIAAGEREAPATWEQWRDTIRDLHEAARERRQSGAATFSQKELLRRILANAPEEKVDPDLDPDALTYQEAREWISRLREGGVQPTPTEKQMEYVRSLVEDLDLSPGELEEHIGVPDPDAIRTSGQASEAIETLKEIHAERQPPSAKQRRFIDDLVKRAELGEGEAAALVGVESLDDLTGGAEGSASALIDALQERLEGDKGE